MDLWLAICLALALVYVLVRVGASAWFGVKLKYQRNLLQGLSKGDQNGQSVKE